MSKFEIVMPRMGEGIIEATIIRWLKKEGEKVVVDEPILEIATDKVDSEIVATGEGILVKQLFKEGEIVPIGKVVALISTDGKLDLNETESHETNDSCSSDICDVK